MVISGNLAQTPAPGSTHLRFCGDLQAFKLVCDPVQAGTAYLRTNLGQADIHRQEIVDAVHKDLPPLAKDWFDVPMSEVAEGCFQITVPLSEVGHFEGKCYFLPEGSTTPHWPAGANTALNVEPADTVCGNTIYNAFVRQFGANKYGLSLQPEQSLAVKALDEAGFSVIPPTGTFRDLMAELDFIIGTLGCRVVMLLPIHPTPTTYARMGRFGSPYAALNFKAVDPALAQFDPKATPTEQFLELVDAVHARQAKLFLDIAINHTGWAATLHDTHPQWLVRDRQGRIEMPGAWGVTWADLTRLDYSQKALWRYMAGVFELWCRRGVDGFRCDAGYMIPVEAWKYIVARVRQRFPETIFILEGLGGPMAVTRRLLDEAGLNWAYSELFQNYDRAQIEHYLPEPLAISQAAGLMVNFAETHDNERLAARSKTWARLRTALTALSAPYGAFGFANGVEWYADTKIDVHGAPSLNWGADDNQVDYLRRINLILCHHPLFADGVAISQVQSGEGNFVALLRHHQGSGQMVLVLANLDDRSAVAAGWQPEVVGFGEGPLWDLVSGEAVAARWQEGTPRVDLAPGQVMCLTHRNDDLERLEKPEPKPFDGLLPRVLRQRLRSKVLEIVLHYKGVDDCAALALDELAEELRDDPVTMVRNFMPDSEPAPVVEWQWPRDERREVMVAPDHMLLVRAPAPFRVTLAAGEHTKVRQLSLPGAGEHHFALLMPLPAPEESYRRYRLKITLYRADRIERSDGPVRYLRRSGQTTVSTCYLRRDIRHARPLLLDSNGRGAMLRAPLRWAELTSRYDALLAGNLNPDYPEDRWIMFTRCRVWVVYQGFSTEINGNCFQQFVHQPGSGGVWRFVVPTGQGEFVTLRIGAAMATGRNAMGLLFYRESDQDGGRSLKASRPVRIILRPDVEDRSYHDTTKAHAGPETAFRHAFRAEADRVTFGQDARRLLRIDVPGGQFFPEPEWHYMVHRPLEAERGLDPDSDLFSPGYFQFELTGGEHALLTATMAESDGLPDDFERRLIDVTATELPGDRHPLDTALHAALQAYVVKRTPLKSVIAGYPWFLDWGRDALIAVRGMIAAGMTEAAREVLLQFGRFEENGTLPNMIQGQAAGNRDTSDAPLWFFTACHDLVRAEGSHRFLRQACGDRTVGETLLAMAKAVVKGTPNGVGMDPASGLVFSPTHFTWMDTNHPAGTPREGYPIEIQALWHAALRFLCRINGDEQRWAALADQVRESITRLFVLPDSGYLSDCLHASPGVPAQDAEPDDALRPNQLLVVTLGAVTDQALMQTVVLACRELIVPGAIRSLADRPLRRPLPIAHHGQALNDPYHPYQGRYAGDEDTRRKPAYHNGTAWTWIFPSFCEAWAIAFNHSPGARTAARAWLQSALDLLNGGCVGQIPEILDGDAPHAPRGCDAQAWGVSEVLRVLRRLDDGE